MGETCEGESSQSVCVVRQTATGVRWFLLKLKSIVELLPIDPSQGLQCSTITAN